MIDERFEEVKAALLAMAEKHKNEDFKVRDVYKGSVIELLKTRNELEK